MVVCNTDEYSSVEPAARGKVSVGDIAVEVKGKTII
jgi:hypothetical protein